MIEIPSPREQRDILGGTLGRFRDFLLGRKSRRRLAGPDVHVRGFVTARHQTPGGAFTPWETFPNGATYEGLNYDLEAAFRAGTQVTAWYCGLVAGGSFVSVSVNDTAASHANWTEEQQYSGNRPQWSPTAASAGQLTITTAISVTATAAISVQGIFVQSIATKGNSTGKLWATAVEGAPRAIANTLAYQFYYSTLFTPVS